ncbi:MAG: hypothetical protein EU551_01895 [Promethearchaeota archaeon]|nr:MAG: hypothetical protein EU551_01895 [Candidatus Lokiarchaeota archaeon]
MYYFDILEEFFKNGIKYLIVGGLAVNLYGIPRVTQDMDIIISMDKDNILKINDILKKLNYVPRLPVDPNQLADKKTLKNWIIDKNLRAFSFYNKSENYKTIDILIDHPLNFEDSFQHKTIRKIKSIEIYLAPLDDLITMKRNTNRKQDISDIKLLKRLKKWMEKDEA